MKRQAKNKKTKKQAKPINKHKVLKVVGLLGVAIIIFLLLGGYKVINQAYHSVKVGVTHKREFQKLNEPLSTFGITNINRGNPACSITQIYGYEGDSLLCVTTQDQFIKIDKETRQQESFVSSAKRLDDLLKTNGWKTESNSANSFDEWMKAITTGKDFNTDINATKTVGGVKCIVIMTVAYSNPNPPAINTSLSCNSPNYPQSAATITVPQ